MKHKLNETVAMDLKEWTKGTGFYIVDHITRYSAQTVIKIKKKQLIVEEIFKIWIKAFGFLKNVKRSLIIKFSLNFDEPEITIKTAAIEHKISFGNRLAELAQALGAKNSTQSAHGVSTNQLFMREILNIFHFSMANNLYQKV